MIVDASDLIVGRIGTVVAKQALMGEKVHVINCEKAVISGDKKSIFLRYKEIKERGDTFKGPFFQSMPDRFLRRLIRGMLPYKKERGRLAYKRIHCHLGVPESLAKEKMQQIEAAHISKTKSLKYISIGELCGKLGGNYG